MKLLFIGHTVGIKLCIQAVKELDEYEVVGVYTHERLGHKYDLELFERFSEEFGKYAYDVFSVKEDYGIDVKEYSNIEKKIGEIKEQYNPDCIVTIGCRDILSQKFIDSFAFLINLHPFNLPSFRGAGIDSWMILQGYCGTRQNSTAHFITHKIDSGNILARIPYDIPKDATPLEIFKVRIDTLGDLMLKALNTVAVGGKGEPQNAEDARYFPKLFTPRDGKINFNWSGSEIELFVQSFSYPYPGAFVIYNEKKISFHKSEFFPDESVHPFAYGLILAKSMEEGIISIYVKGGVLNLKELTFEKGIELKLVKLGKFVN